MSDDLISRRAAIDAIGGEPKYKVRLFRKTYAEGRADQWWRDIGAIHRLPSAESQRKKGKWKDKKYRWIDSIAMWWSDSYECSVCGDAGIKYWNFCPNCGAEMEGCENGRA